MARTTAFVLAVLAAALIAGGTWLLWLGGSPFYALAGIVLALTAFLVWRRSEPARLVYALLLVATLGWSLWEVGLDWWPLAARGGVLILIGAWLLTPWPLRATPRTPSGAALGLVLLVCLEVAAASIVRDPTELAGRLPPAPAERGDVGPTDDWRHYGGTLAGQRYSALDEITPANIDRLETAWVYRTGDVRRADDVSETTYQVTPLKIGRFLYLCTPHHIAIALDAATGAELWRFDPKIPLEQSRQHQTCRGVSFFESAVPAVGAGTPQACAARVFLPTADARLIALDAETGIPCAGFGTGGVVDLWANMPHQREGFYYATSPPVVARGLVIVGGAVNDNYDVAAPSGVIRAYDATTGTLVWNWDSGNPDETAPLPPGETYTENSPNSWSISSADEALGLLYVPLGNRTPDQLGMGRSAAVERFSSSIVALDLATGAVRWVRQTVHHDLWDMDVPAQPALLDLDGPSGPVPALVGPTKQGDVYVLDRRTGEPIQPVREVAAPGGAIPEDFTAPTQPVSALSFAPEPLREADMWGASLFDQLACRIRFRSLRYEGRYTPPSVQGTLVYPGNFGVFNWGSVAVDPVRRVMFGMPTYLAFTSTLIPADQVGPDAEVNTGEAGLNMNVGGPYAVIMQPFTSPLGLPCQQPPWGYVAGVDLQTGAIAWRHRNGTVQDAASVPLPPIELGVPGIGGPLLTAGGVAFLGATIDDYLRGYDVDTGAEIWRARLPAGGQATPMSYRVDGRQFVVHVAGGHGSIGTTAGDFVIAYALPRDAD